MSLDGAGSVFESKAESLCLWAAAKQRTVKGSGEERVEEGGGAEVTPGVTECELFKEPGGKTVSKLSILHEKVPFEGHEMA